VFYILKITQVLAVYTEKEQEEGYQGFHFWINYTIFAWKYSNINSVQSHRNYGIQNE
jgi:hypothetical protein